MTATSDEYRHEGAAEEAWAFDASDVSAGFGVVARLTYRAASREAWWWAGAVGLGPALVALRVPDAPLPRRGTTVRTDGLWASLECEEPLVHWSVGMECFAVAYDDPWEAARSERGDVVPFGLDLSFEAEAEAGAASPSAPAGPGASGYGQWCHVTGEVLLGDLRVPVDCGGHRGHAWGAAGLPSPYLRVRGAPPYEEVAVCPFIVPGGVWVETLCRAADGDIDGEGEGGWSGRLTPAM